PHRALQKNTWQRADHGAPGRRAAHCGRRHLITPSSTPLDPDLGSSPAEIDGFVTVHVERHTNLSSLSCDCAECHLPGSYIFPGDDVCCTPDRRRYLRAHRWCNLAGTLLSHRGGTSLSQAQRREYGRVRTQIPHASPSTASAWVERG